MGNYVSSLNGKFTPSLVSITSDNENVTIVQNKTYRTGNIIVMYVDITTTTALTGWSKLLKLPVTVYPAVGIVTKSSAVHIDWTVWVGNNNEVHISGAQTTGGTLPAGNYTIYATMVVA